MIKFIFNKFYNYLHNEDIKKKIKLFIFQRDTSIDIALDQQSMLHKPNAPKDAP